MIHVPVKSFKVQINQFLNGQLRQLKIVDAQCYHRFCCLFYVKFYLLPLHNNNTNNTCEL